MSLHLFYEYKQYMYGKTGVNYTSKTTSNWIAIYNNNNCAKYNLQKKLDGIRVSLNYNMRCKNFFRYFRYLRKCRTTMSILVILQMQVILIQ
jgi:hypothetical protein